MSALLDSHTWLVIAHIFGVALGAGGAFTGDAIFLSSVRDRRVSRAEARLMDVAGRMVWIGLAILILSGVGLVLARPDIFLSSDKFWAKMTIVGVILVNGLAFHYRHRPVLHRNEEAFSPSHDIVRGRAMLLTSGAISVVSWSFAIILGVFRRLSFGFWDYVLVYLGVVAVAVLVALLLRNRIIPSR